MDPIAAMDKLKILTQILIYTKPLQKHSQIVSYIYYIHITLHLNWTVSSFNWPGHFFNLMPKPKVPVRRVNHSTSAIVFAMYVQTSPS